MDKKFDGSNILSQKVFIQKGMSTHNEILKAKADGKFDLPKHLRGPGKFNVCFRHDQNGEIEDVILVKWEQSFCSPAFLTPLYSLLDWSTKPSQRLILVNRSY
jgi:hypothetical protein